MALINKKSENGRKFGKFAIITAIGVLVTTQLASLCSSRLGSKSSYLQFIQSKAKAPSETEPSQRPPLSKNVFLCKAKSQHFVMIKIGKTGTTTLYSILARFAVSHRLNLLYPKVKYHISWTGKNDGKETWKIGPEPVERADVLLNHAKYNKSIFDKYIKRDYKLIVPVREPVSWMRSAIKYYAQIAKVTKYTPDEVIGNNKLLFRSRPEKLSGLKTWFHIPQLQWLGFDYSKRDNLSAVKSFIAEIIPRINVFILNDQYDASLLIMKKRLCWDYTDIFHMSHNIRRSSHISISPESVEKLLSLEVNLGDKLLYEAVNKTWWQQPELKERDFWKEVTYFSALNRNMTSQICPAVLRKHKSRRIQATSYHSTLIITKTLCKQIREEQGDRAVAYASQTLSMS